ncbi:unnamed protein product [Chironomus riparius]|uniref:Coronin n=1 Tax=Chironomus riparius TaxID=315576 RepID=A0A9P0NGA9_9DIPT|nr:unnamed protein product [Chironomus riparius]
MAWRFKASKYKNSVPIVPKIEECVRDIVVGSYQNYGNNITASAKFMAFPIEHSGSTLAVLPIDDSGRKPKNMPALHGHTDTVNDLAFSPFHDNLLATGSQDSLVKIWHIPEEGLKESLTNPECTFSHKQKKVENVGFHPTADCLLYSTAASNVSLWDLTEEKEIFTNGDHPEIIQSLSWKGDGTVFATNSKDKMVRIVDPRSNSPISIGANSHQNIKDSRVVWLGDQQKILTTGFDSNRLRQVMIRDLRSFSTPEKTLELEQSTGILIPLYDPDTNMLFLAGKGDITINFLEVTDRDPYLIEGIRHTGEQTKGACFIPKRSLRVMEGEVNRVMQLTSNSVIPIMYQVPRKSYRDFHSDIFPDTNGFRSELKPQDWMSGKNYVLPKISLDPAKTDIADMVKEMCVGNLEEIRKNLNEIEKHQTNGQQAKQHVIIPKKEKTQNFNVETKSSNNETSEFLEKFKAVRMQKNLDNKTVENGSKPRLGPKPFSLDSTDNTFDKVFAVPHVPIVKEAKEHEKELMKEKIQPEASDDVEIAKESDVEDQKQEDSPPVSERDNFARDDEQRKSIADRRRIYENRSQSQVEEKKPSPILMKRQDSAKTEKKESKNEIGMKRTSTVFGKVSKFRHLKGTAAHKSFHIENLKNISRQIPPECDVFYANDERVAVPISGQGGKIAVFELSKTGRLPDGVIPCLVNGNSTMDYQWDPFDSRILAVGCDDGRVKIWNIPEDGLTESTNSPTQEFGAHAEKISFIKFHPLAKNVLLTASYDLTLKIWDLNDLSEKITLKGHTDQIYCFCWSPCGKYGATVCRDGKIRIYNPRKSSNPVREGIGAPIGTRGSRIQYALNGEYLVVTGFDKVSERQVYVFKTSNLNDALGMVSLDVSPALLIPYYDEDSSTIFLTGKGDTTIYTYEVTEEAPYLCPLSHHRSPSIHQGLSFLPKNQCDVASVEFAKCYRLTNNSIEPLSFTVPRIKIDYFQDDLFPPTRMVWNPTMTSTEWFEQNDKPAVKVSLKPKDMEPLSSLSRPNESKIIDMKPVDETSYMKNSNSNNGQNWTEEELKSKTDDLKKSVSARVSVNYALEQDRMEGVDPEEWDE